MSPPARRPAAFTLIEVVAVLAITALLAGLAAVALAGPRARAAADDAVGQLAFADATVRRQAAAADAPLTLVIDPATGQLSRGDGDGHLTTLATLPAGVRVTRVLAGGDTIDAGPARVPVSAAGRGRSYAVGLSTGAGPRWVVVAGLTGRLTPLADEAAARAVLDRVRP